MKQFNQIQAWLEERRTRGMRTLGFVPTMGNLHMGHISLIQHSQKDNDDTLVSIFVNQAQFNTPEDYQNYPRTLEADLTYLKDANVTYCLLPNRDEIYSDDYRFQIHETTHHLKLEGKHRPGHFTGVLTVIMKLLNITQPTRLYLGEKDFEQLQYIKDMVAAFFMDVDVIGGPTLREESGLAYSSRNNRLSPAGRKKADAFAKCFLSAASLENAREALSAFDVEYLEEDFQRRFVVVNIEGVRLIDNVALSN